MRKQITHLCSCGGDAVATDGIHAVTGAATRTKITMQRVLFVTGEPFFTSIVWEKT